MIAAGWSTGESTRRIQTKRTRWLNWRHLTGRLIGGAVKGEINVPPVDQDEILPLPDVTSVDQFKELPMVAFVDR